MSYQALYRKWRPAVFEEMVGQDAVVTTLQNQIRADRIGHAYLFCGTRGTGKTSAAKIFARAVNCPHARENGGSPCNRCEICESILSGRAMNVIEIDAASNNGVDNIRDIREQVEYPPVTGRYKVYIIDEVHMLSPGAFNALLKTLEEPPAYVIFILATTDPQKIPQTILSRCQRYDFRRMSRRTCAQQLQKITRQEGMKVEDKALMYIAEAADGSMRDALSLLDQCAAYHYGEMLTYDHVLEILGAADATVFSRLYHEILSGQIEEALRIVGEMINSGAEVVQLVNDFIWYLRNVLLAGSGASEDALEISEEKYAMVCADAALAERSRLVAIMSALAELVNRIRFSPQKRVMLEVELVRLCAMEGGPAAVAPVSARLRINLNEHGRPAVQQAGIQQTAPQRQTATQIQTAPQIQTGALQTGTQASGPTAMPAANARPAEAPAENDYTGEINPAGLRFSGNKIVREQANEGAEAEAETEAESRYYQPEGPQSGQLTELQTGSQLRPQAEEMRRPQAGQRTEQQTPFRTEQQYGPETEPEQNLQMEPVDLIRQHWEELVAELSPSNKPLFHSVSMQQEKNYIMLIFRNQIHFRLAAHNVDENGLTKLKEIVAARFGIQTDFRARIARPGEVEEVDNRATDEELKQINFPVDIEVG